MLVIFALVIAQIPFGLAYWVSDFNAPYAFGDHNLIIKATYGNFVGMRILNLSVYDYMTSSPELAIRPLPQEDYVTPITLQFEITLKGKPVQTLRTSNVILVFTEGDISIYNAAGPLQGSDGLFSITVDVPFKGDYSVIVYVEAEENGELYSGTFTSEFYSSEISPEVELEIRVDHRVLTPGEAFGINMKILMGTKGIGGAATFKSFLDGLETTLVWNDEKELYETSLNALEEEGIFKVYLYSESQDFARYFDIYVLDPAKNQSARCPIRDGDSCSSREDARKCFVDYRAGETFLTEDMVIECMLNAGYVPALEFSCDSSALGDLNIDGKLDEIDAYIFAQYVLAISEQNERQQYVGCADYDRNLIVDENDFTCLVNVIAGNWLGDIGGGICFSFDKSSPLKGDMDADKKITEDDLKVFRDLVVAADRFDMPPEILNHMDFNQDGALTAEDTRCLEKFLGLSLADREVLTIEHQVSAECMAIYHLDNCRNVPGDMNGDLIIDEIDEILIMMANREAIPQSIIDMSCADVNDDTRVTDEDEVCVKAYVSGDVEKYFVCIDCIDRMPKEVFSTLEICNDGWDNDCDGFVDRTSDNPDEDWCACMEDTPCEMLFDLDMGMNLGATMDEAMPPSPDDPGAQGKGTLVCRDMSWDGEDYKWTRIVPCSGEIECETSTCDHRTNLCAYDGEKHDWYPEAAPPEETDDPGDSPKTCDDSHDNDCQGGDEKCKSNAWIAIVVFIIVLILIMLGPVLLGAFASQAITTTTSSAVTMTTAGGATTTVAAGGTLTIPAGTFISAGALEGMAGLTTLAPTFQAASSVASLASTGTRMATSP